MLRRFCLLLTAFCVAPALSFAADTAKPKIVIIAGPKSHGPVGNGMHDYGWSAKLLKVMLDNSNVADRVRVEIHLDGWPADPSTLDDAATIMVISDGRDGPAFAEAPHLASPQNIAAVQKQIDRGCGFLTFHFSTFAPDAYAQQILDWSGGYFDWETDGERKWYSNIKTMDADVEPATPGHPILSGVGPFTVHEEFYYDLRLNTESHGIAPIWTVPALPGREPDGRVVAWARERPSGGRGFGTTGGHFYANWESPEFRRTILNALVWTAKLDVPAAGVQAPYYTHAEITAALAGVDGTQPAKAKPIKVLILTGHQYPGHVWQDTTPAIADALKRDARMQVDVSEQIEDLATDKINAYDALVLNYCNWEKPGISDAAKAGFVKYLQDGGGLVIVHFANGAFHFSLPKAEDSDWPEYRNICRRVWNHKGDSGHDKYGKFIVEIDDHEHPITKSLEPFETIDELYFRQAGDAPIHVLASARSQVTGQPEPMAFVYDYGKGRVFQTVLGHAAESLRTDGAAQLLCRGAAWAAGRDPIDVTLAAAPPAAAAPPPKNESQPALAVSKRPPLADGKFGRSLDAHAGAVFAPPRPEFSAPPLTVELWAKLDRRDDYNILLANESKASATHWEIFSHPGNGHLTVYAPGLAPDHVHTQTDIVDNAWHSIAMQYAPDRIRLFVDGKLVGDQAVAPVAPATLPQIPGELGVGSLISRKLGCGGLIDDVRISRGLRHVERAPDAPLARDDDTLGLWRFDALDNTLAADETGRDGAKWESSTSERGTPVRLQRKKDQDAIDWAQGFLWADEASRQDERWNQTQLGPALASIVEFASGSVAKGLSIRLGDNGDAAMTYDTQRMCVRAGWTGKFLKFDPTRFGLIKPPAPAGELQFEAPPIDGWTGGAIAFRGQHRHNNRVVLEYTVGETRVLESPTFENTGDRTAFVRQFEVAAHPSPLILRIGKFGEQARLIERDGLQIAVCGTGTPVCIALAGKGASSLEVGGDGIVVATLPDSEQVNQFDVLMSRCDEQQLGAFAAAIRQHAAPTSLAALTAPGKLLWPETITTRGTLGKDDDAYAVDTVAVPFDNPYQALIFTSGFDFLRDGRAAVSAIHGDVWLVDGLDADLDSVTWKRFATGLFQPLGLKIVNDEIYVIGRDQITRLHDLNRDGEADFYENFASGYLTSTSGHDYVTCLETDPQGNFYFAHGVEGVMRVSPSGGNAAVVATGLRNPNGLGVGPQGMVTAAPQEGEWTPVSNIAVAHEGNHFGYKGGKVTDKRPLGYDQPLCWIPRVMDNSSGGQVWATGNQWGPLNGQMLHLSFGQCRAMLVLMEEVDGQWQGGTVSLPWNFQSGAMRGRVDPHNGQVWVSGLKGWTTRAADDGCLQRVRYTGKPVYLPIAVKHHANGIALSFTAPLDPEVAQDPDSYHGEQWNYLWSQAYGSADYKPSQPGIEGHDPLEIVSATLQPDKKTVFLEIKDFAPVMQIKIDYQLTAADGHEFRNTYYGTLNKLPATSVPDSQIVRVPRHRLPPEVEASLKPGILNETIVNDGRLIWGSTGVDRLPALTVEVSQPVRSVSAPGKFKAEYTGYIQVPLRGDYTFTLEGSGTADLRINGEALITGTAEDLKSLGTARVRLRTGFNALSMEYTSQADGSGRLRLLWEHESFSREPVPPTVLFHRDNTFNSDLKQWQSIREGRELFAVLHCDRCHASQSSTAGRMPEIELDPPNLAGSGKRLNQQWIAQWLIDPLAHRPQATMPALFDARDPDAAQQAADVAAYVVTLSAARPDVSRETLPASEVTVNSQQIETGARLYEQFACLACHRFTSPGEVDQHDRVSLAEVGSKYQPGELSSYLQRPQQNHSGTRMPDFRLTTYEADELTAMLLSKSTAGTAQDGALAGDVERGRKLFTAKNCDRCHATTIDPGSAPAAQPIPLKDLERGCLAESGGSAAIVPNYRLSEVKRLAIRSFIALDVDALNRDTPAEAAERLIRQFNCGACHSRDNDTAPRQMLTVEEGSGIVPDAIPQLTWTGEKLRSDWLAKFLAGERHAPLRPWLKARMPAFPAIASVLADGLRAQHGIAAESEPPFTPDSELAAIGAKLAAPTALDCRQCHGVGPEEPRGDKQTLIALGVNFSDSRERLRRDFYDRFVLNPPRCDPGLRMPVLSSDGKTTKITTVFGGDATKQFDALWHYLQLAPPRTTASSE
ncbi:MAG: ThuA domain-containing protein [Planctomycetaceae bacterium]